MTNRNTGLHHETGRHLPYREWMGGPNEPRRFRDLTSGLRHDMARALSAAEESLIEVMTAAGALGEGIATKELVRISGAVGRTLAALGLTQRPDRISPYRTANSESNNYPLEQIGDG